MTPEQMARQVCTEAKMGLSNGDVRGAITALERPIALAIHDAVNAAVGIERKRCEGWVMAARMGNVDGDLRSIIGRIQSNEVPTDEEAGR